MEFLQPEVIGSAVAQLGVAGVFLYLYFQEKASHKEKDDRIAEMTDNLLEAYKKNAEVIHAHEKNLERLSTTMEATQNTMHEVKEAVSGSKEAVKTLTEFVYRTSLPNNKER